MKYQTDDFVKACGCRSVDECLHNIGAERAALVACVDGFADALKAKLISKMHSNKSGWDDPSWPRDDIVLQLIEHIDKGDMVDVAAFAMFAWNQEGGSRAYNEAGEPKGVTP